MMGDLLQESGSQDELGRLLEEELLAAFQEEAEEAAITRQGRSCSAASCIRERCRRCRCQPPAAPPKTPACSDGAPAAKKARIGECTMQHSVCEACGRLPCHALEILPAHAKPDPLTGAAAVAPQAAPAALAPPSAPAACPPHPGFMGGICIRCGALRGDAEEKGVALSYIHRGLEVSKHEAERLRQVRRVRLPVCGYGLVFVACVWVHVWVGAPGAARAAKPS